MEWQERIVADLEILVGKPLVRDTRLAVELVIELLARGWVEAEILSNYPGLTPEDIRACLLCANHVRHSEKVHLLSTA